MGAIDKFDISIDRDECIGDGACVNEAPETFELDDEAKAVVLPDSNDDEDSIIEAAKACPLDIIVVKNKETGEQIYPEE
jgi:ferredoxin